MVAASGSQSLTILNGFAKEIVMLSTCVAYFQKWPTTGTEIGYA